jgi:hypothetical protein
MSARAVRAQLRELAETLHVAPEELAELADLDVETLAVLHERIAARLHERYAADYARFDTFLRFVPLRWAIPLANKALPPRLLGRLASRAARTGALGTSLTVLTKVDPGVVADAARFLDPRTLAPLAELAPPEMMGAVFNELMRRNDFTVADRFLAYLSADG